MKLTFASFALFSLSFYGNHIFGQEGTTATSHHSKTNKINLLTTILQKFPELNEVNQPQFNDIWDERGSINLREIICGITFPRFWLEEVEMPGVGRMHSNQFMKLKCATPVPTAPPRLRKASDADYDYDNDGTLDSRRFVEPGLNKDLMYDYVNEYPTMEHIKDGDYKSIGAFAAPESNADSVFGVYSSLSSDGKIAAIASEFEIAVYKFNSWCNKWELRGNYIHDSDEVQERIYQVALSGSGNFVVSVHLDEADESVVHVHKFDFLTQDWVKVGDDIWDFYFVSGIDIDNDGDTIVVTAIDADYNPFISIMELDSSTNTWTKKSGLDSDDLCDEICALPMSVSYSDNSNYMAFSLSLLGLAWISVVMAYDENTNTWSTLGAPIAEFSCPTYNSTSFESDCYLFSPSKVAVSDSGSTLASGSVIRNGIITHEAIRFHHLVDNDWETRYNTTYSGTSPSYMGFFVDLSSDGETAIVGAPLFETYTGALVVFKYDSETELWSEVFNLEGSQDDKDILGWSAMLSGDGKTFVVGSPGAEDLDGSAKVYSIDCKMTSTRAGRLYNLFSRDSTISKFYFPLRKY